MQAETSRLDQRGGDPASQSLAPAGVHFVLRANIVITVTLGTFMLAGGRIADSTTLIAEGWHTLGDGILGALSMYAALLSARGADEEHPYGREKFEHLAGAVMGGVLVVLATEMCLDFVGHFVSSHPHRPVFSWEGVVTLLILVTVRCTWAIGLAVFAKRTASVVTGIEARHALVDSMVTLVAVCTALGGQWAYWLDVVGGLGVIGVIALTGVGLLRNHAPWLADRSVVPTSAVQHALLEFNGFTVRRSRSRGTPTRAFVEAVVEAPLALSLREASAIAHAMEETIRDKIPKVSEALVIVHAPACAFAR